MQVATQGTAVAIESRGGIERVLDVKLSTLLYYSALSVWLFVNILYTSFYAIHLVGIIKAFRVACVSMLLLSILADNSFTGKWLAGLALGLMAAVIKMRVSQSIMVDTIVFILCSSRRDPRVIAKVSMASMVISVLVVVLSAKGGLITDYVTYGERVRDYLGFRYALYPSAFVFSITCLAVYLLGDGISVYSATILFLVNYLCYAFTNSRLALGTALLVISLSMLFAAIGNTVVRVRWVRSVMGAIFILAAAFSLYMAYTYDQTSFWVGVLHHDLMARAEYAHRAVTEFGTSLLGHDIKNIMVGAGLNMEGVRSTEEYFYVDNLYVRLWIEGGVVIFLTYVIGMTLCIRKSLAADGYGLAIVLFTIALYGLVDNLMMNLYYNPFLLFMGLLIRDRDTSFSVIERDSSSLAHSGGRWQ